MIMDEVFWALFCMGAIAGGEAYGSPVIADKMLEEYKKRFKKPWVGEKSDGTPLAKKFPA